MEHLLRARFCAGSLVCMMHFVSFLAQDSPPLFCHHPHFTVGRLRLKECKQVAPGHIANWPRHTARQTDTASGTYAILEMELCSHLIDADSSLQGDPPYLKGWSQDCSMCPC